MTSQFPQSDPGSAKARSKQLQETSDLVASARSAHARLLFSEAFKGGLSESDLKRLFEKFEDKVAEHWPSHLGQEKVKYVLSGGNVLKINRISRFKLEQSPNLA